MSKDETPVWGIHAGRSGDADALFKRGYVALGWAEMGDLGDLAADREAFKERYAAVYPGSKPGAVNVNAGQLFRFVHEMKPEDIVVYRSKVDHQIHLGRITGDYQYAPKLSAAYPDLRPAARQWTVPVTSFTQGALYELGSAMTLFQIRNYADEFRAALAGKATPQSTGGDETIALVAEEIQQNTRAFILKQLAQELKGHPFAAFVAHLLGTMGYRTRISPEGSDGGVDIVAHRDELGFEPPIVKVQVKSTTGSVGQPEVSALIGTLAPSEFGLVVTLGSFTAHARNFAKSKANVRLIDGEELVDLVLDHYDQIDPRYKGLVPLKRVYVPEPLEGGEA